MNELKVKTYGQQTATRQALRRAKSALKRKTGFIPVGFDELLKRKVSQFDEHGKQFSDLGDFQ